MPTRKQRRRRQKELRHEYEYVYVDEEGHEVEAESQEEPKSTSRVDRRNGKRDDKSPPQKGRAGRAIREATLEAVAEGIRTADLSGHHGTSAFADEVVRRTRTKLEVWAAL